MTDMLPDIDEIRREAAATIHDHWKFFLADGVLMMLLGAAAIVVPNKSSPGCRWSPHLDARPLQIAVGFAHGELVRKGGHPFEAC